MKREQWPRVASSGLEGRGEDCDIFTGPHKLKNVKAKITLRPLIRTKDAQLFSGRLPYFTSQKISFLGGGGKSTVPFFFSFLFFFNVQ